MVVKLDNLKMIIMSQVTLVITFKRKFLKYSWRWNQGWRTLCEFFVVKIGLKWKMEEIENRKKIIKEKYNQLVKKILFCDVQVDFGAEKLPK